MNIVQPEVGRTSENLCKICLSGESDEINDPMLSPCKCSGSVRYIHLQCLQSWIKSRLNVEQSKSIMTIFWKNLHCELCKEELPISLNHNGNNFSLLPMPNKISGCYIMMESFSKENNSTGIHLIDLSSNQKFRIVTLIYQNIKIQREEIQIAT